ncbi:hypothetical protein BJF80_03815 [Serinicoccus sp. CUA-874]|uniref:hypothetical protein n=1 Tax=Serinicoccus TaxID=265976 RepID=UPI0003B35080|nr:MULTISPECIES: hypothetical protein [Serinicoccus]OLT17285.1 hypothetical protein BJF80_03815 [Serinicoccus sp. CUA-874]
MENMIVTGGLAVCSTDATPTLRSRRHRDALRVSGAFVPGSFGPAVETTSPHAVDPALGLGSSRTP